jgi:hypothetical protein
MIHELNYDLLHSPSGELPLAVQLGGWRRTGIIILFLRAETCGIY